MQPQRPRAGRRRSDSGRRADAPPPAPAPNGYEPFGPAGPGHGPPSGPGYGPPSGPGHTDPGYPPDGYGPEPERRRGSDDVFGVNSKHGMGGDLDRAFEGAHRERIRQVVVGVVAVTAVIAIGGGGFWMWATSGAMPLAGGAPNDAGETRSPSGGVDHIPSEPPVVKPRASVYLPAKGTGTFSRPVAGTRTFGRGKLMRYMVQVEGGLRQNPAAFTQEVDRVLANPRGWTGDGKWAFRRVSSGPYDFVVRLASPATTDKLCAKAGLDTEGKVNCSAGKQVVVNLRRWLLLTTYYRGQPSNYHALVINHEVGHRLGHNHMTCGGKGRPAPVMMQQIFGLKGCRINGWPFDARGRYITGPAVR